MFRTKDPPSIEDILSISRDAGLKVMEPVKGRDENVIIDRLAETFLTGDGFSNYGDLLFYPNCKSDGVYARMIYNSDVAKKIRKQNESLENLKKEYGITDNG